MRRAYVICVVLVLAALPAVSQESQLDFSFGPRFWGATVFTRYSLTPPAVDAVETSLIVGLSSAYESLGYFRNPDQTLFTDGDSGYTADQATYNRFDAYWQLGVQQGIVSRLDVSEDLAVAFFYYRGRYNLPFDDGSLYFSSGLPEVNGGLLGSVHAGLAYSNIVDTDVTAVRRGILGEFVLQWGPAFLHNNLLGSANFTRTTLSTRVFSPLFERTSPEGRNSFSAYSAMFAAVDWATGSEVPMAVRSTIGTRSERPGTGGSVRGFRSYRFDSTFKAVANAEVRFNFPTVPIGSFAAIIPGALVYSDVGYFNDSLSADGEFSPNADDQSGFLSSSGLGVYADIRNVAEIIFYTNFLSTPAAVDGSRWVPFTLGFGFHY